MNTSSVSNLFILLCILIYACSILVHCNTVTYDEKAIVINGKRQLLISGSIHYPRSTPQMWSDLIQKAKDGGLNVIDTYVFWDIHEPSPGRYDFSGRKDIVKFIKIAHKAGLYVQLRLGVYIHAEWNFGGIPVWLKFVNRISFRTDNEPFKNAMQGFVTKIVQLMKSEKLFHPQGGPIILCQIENEYGSEEKALGVAGYNYMTWAVAMANNQNTGVPWVMCKQPDAPDPVINTCNGFYCHEFIPNSPKKPKMWTEAWSGWFEEFGIPRERRSFEDLAFAVALFFAKSGTFVNYYMYHGGTNFGRSGGPFITPSYYYDAPIEETGLLREPKYRHLKELHNAIRLCETALLYSNPTVKSLSRFVEAHVFSAGKGKCAAFLSNLNTKSGEVVEFNGRQYFVPAWSVSILNDCVHVAFNTAQRGVPTSKTHMLPSSSKLHSWEAYDEEIYYFKKKSRTVTVGLLDQINVTRDSSDYLWYSTTFFVKSSEIQQGNQPLLVVKSVSHGVYVFVNGQLMGSKYGTKDRRGFTYIVSINLQAGTNHISLLSVLVGLWNGGAYFEKIPSGLVTVFLDGLHGGRVNLTQQKWSNRVGLIGEKRDLGSLDEVSPVNWIQNPVAANKYHTPLTWYKAYFDAPNAVGDPLYLDLKSMYKGGFWVNGIHVGRYWLIKGKGICMNYSYVGDFRPVKGYHACNHPTQRLYSIPKEWLKPTKNVLVLMEERGGDVSKVSIVRKTLTV